MSKYKEYFGLKNDPFSNDLKEKDLLKLPGTLSVKERMDYVADIGGIMIVTGDVGSGKSTALRWSLSQYHRSEIVIINVIASTGSSNELYKQLCWGLGIVINTSGKCLLVKEFKNAIVEIVKNKKQKILLVIDEANLLRQDVFAELHTITQFNFDSKNNFSLILSGQSNLLDKLKYRTSLALASRVVTKTHLGSISLELMKDYLKHHLKISGVNKMIFTDEAVVAIYQASGGILRKANLIARGSLVACAIEEENDVHEEHVKIATTELIL